METKDIDFSKLSPMMKQYFEVKNKYKNHILFYRLGDFLIPNFSPNFSNVRLTLGRYHCVKRA